MPDKLIILILYYSAPPNWVVPYSDILIAMQVYKKLDNFLDWAIFPQQQYLMVVNVLLPMQGQRLRTLQSVLIVTQ